jgi:ribose 5-phosphate isomerase B
MTAAKPRLRVGLGSDHAGYRFKSIVAAALAARGYVVRDFGTSSEAPVDYPDFVRPVALAVAQGEIDSALVFGGSGNGEAMAANRVRGVRCAVAWNVESARLARAHNDANVLSIGQRMLPESELMPVVDAWFSVPFDGGRHVPRIKKLDDV